MGLAVSKPDSMQLLGMDELPTSSSSSEELYSADDETEDEAKEKLLPGGEEEGGLVGVGEERWWTVALQVFFPFLIAGFGMVAAGLGKQHNFL